MATPTAEQRASVEVSASGRLLCGFINSGFVCSVLGGLQGLALVLGLLVTCLLGATVSFTGSTASISGHTFYVFVLLVSFWCLLTTGFIYISCALSLITTVLLPKTIFFSLYNAMAALFYLVSTITCLGEASAYSSITVGNSDVRPMVIAASVIGIATGSAYILITIAAIITYKRNSST